MCTYSRVFPLAAVHCEYAFAEHGLKSATSGRAQVLFYVSVRVQQIRSVLYTKVSKLAGKDMLDILWIGGTNVESSY